MNSTKYRCKNNSKDREGVYTKKNFGLLFGFFATFSLLINMGYAAPISKVKNKLVWKTNNIPVEIEQKMKGSGSWKEGCPVPIKDLAYLQLSYWGYDDKTHTDGVLVVKKEIAKEVVVIFKDLYRHKFPIEKMKLIDDYGAKDDQSMEDNNTSAFNCRPITGAKTGFSLHSYGTAIDINSKVNPYVKVKNGKTTFSPASGEKFANRDKNEKGMIKKGDSCYKAFIKRGWTWDGGTPYCLSNKCSQDYQHFQKNPLSKPRL